MICKLLIALLITANLPCINLSISKKEYSENDKVVNINIANCSTHHSVFYRVSLQVKTDTGWAYVIGDIGNFYHLEQEGLVELKPGQSEIRKIGISIIPSKYFINERTLFRLRAGYASNRQDTLSHSYTEFTIVHQPYTPPMARPKIGIPIARYAFDSLINESINKLESKDSIISNEDYITMARLHNTIMMSMPMGESASKFEGIFITNLNKICLALDAKMSNAVCYYSKKFNIYIGCKEDANSQYIVSPAGR